MVPVFASILPRNLRSSLIFKRGYHLHRSLFYVPADNERKLSKIFSVNADTCVVELEDGVAINQKQAAREGMCRFFSENADKVNQPGSKKNVAVRVNSPQTSLFSDDMDAVLSVGDIVKTVLIPKVSNKKDVENVRILNIE